MSCLGQNQEGDGVKVFSGVRKKSWTKKRMWELVEWNATLIYGYHTSSVNRLNVCWWVHIVVQTVYMHPCGIFLIFRELPEMSPKISSKIYHILRKCWNLPHLNEEFPYIFYTIFKNLPETKSPWCPFDMYMVALCCIHFLDYVAEFGHILPTGAFVRGRVFIRINTVFSGFCQEKFL